MLSLTINSNGVWHEIDGLPLVIKSSENWSVLERAAERTKLSSVADKAARSIMKPVMYLFQRCQATECPGGAYPNKWPTTANKNVSASF